MRRTLSIVAAAALLVACEDANAPTPSERISVVSFGNGLDNGAYSITLPPAGPHDIYEGGTMMNSYPTLTLVDVKFTGEIPAYHYSGDGRGDFWANIPASGVGNATVCHGQVRVSYSNGMVWKAPCQDPDSVTVTEWSWTTTVSGNGQISRNRGPGDFCGGPCREYTGGAHTFTINRVSAELSLSPTQALVEPGGAPRLLRRPTRAPTRPSPFRSRASPSAGLPMVGPP